MFLFPVKAAALALAAGLAGNSPSAAAKAPAVAVAPAASEWAGFATVGDVVGEVVKADGSGFTLRVFWPAASGKPGHHHWQHSTAGRTPQELAQHVRHMEATLARMAGHQSKGGKEHHHDYPLTYADAGLVRVKTLPPKLDATGAKRAYTDDELKAAKTPQGTPYYAAERSDLKPGQIVDVTLVRPKSVPADKATLSDLRVKYAVVVGAAPTPPAAGNKPGKKN
jgi:hypothetical protein